MRLLLAHWRSLLGAAIAIEPLWRGIKWLWDWLGRYDLVASHLHELRGWGAADFLLNPPPWTIFPLIGIATLLILWDIRRPAVARYFIAPKHRMFIYLALASACLIGIVGFGYAAFLQYKYPPAPRPPEDSEVAKAATEDFRFFSGGINEQTENIGPAVGLSYAPITVKIWVRSDLVSMGKYLVFFIPRGFDMRAAPPLGGAAFHPIRQTYDAVKAMADRFPDVIKRVDSSGASGLGDMGEDNMRFSNETLFTGAIYIYHEGDLTEAERVELRQLYKSKGARAFFRSWRYLKERQAPTR